MYRNQYDQDVTTFSPAGRIHQVEYAMEAIKQGSACAGLRNKDYAVLAAIRLQKSELSSFQQKLFKVDDHIGIGIAGLNADARVIRKYLIDECLDHKFVFESQLQVSRLVTRLSDKSQAYTQTSSKRPYGVGLLFAGYDKTGAHLFQTDPSGNFYEFEAQAIGARSQSSKTYLEKFYKDFDTMSLDELIHHALVSLKGTDPDHKLTSQNCSILYVGRDTPVTVLDDDLIAPYLDKLSDDERGQDKDEKKAMSDD